MIITKEEETLKSGLFKTVYINNVPCEQLDVDKFLKQHEEAKKKAEWLDKYAKEHPEDWDKIIDCMETLNIISTSQKNNHHAPTRI